MTYNQLFDNIVKGQEHHIPYFTPKRANNDPEWITHRLRHNTGPKMGIYKYKKWMAKPLQSKEWWIARKCYQFTFSPLEITCMHLHGNDDALPYQLLAKKLWLCWCLVLTITFSECFATYEVEFSSLVIFVIPLLLNYPKVLRWPSLALHVCLADRQPGTLAYLKRSLELGYLMKKVIQRDLLSV